MDINNYIESGIIESYVLGLTTAEENAEVESMSSQNNQVKQAITEFENLYKKQIDANVITAPAFIKSNLENILSSEFKQDTVKQFAPVKSIAETPVRSISYTRFIAAASVVLLIISTGLNFYFYSAFKTSSNRYQALFNERNTLQANNASYKSQINSLQSAQINADLYKNEVANLERSFKIMQNPDVKEIKLNGVSGKTDIATVYWNTKTKEVYFFQNHMTTTPTGKQYQLWALVNGKPVDAGMIGSCNGLCKMKLVPDAQAFAVTLEKEGGSITPTLTAMTVMGKV